MKIYVSVDMEGIAGIALPIQLQRGEPLYNESRVLLTREVNAVVEALVEAGATEIIVKDAHGSGFNFVPELLHPGATYCMGGTPVSERFPGLDGSFDGAILLGYHAMAGTPRAVRDHTMSSAGYQHFELNGSPIGEIGIDALLFGLHGVPVLLVTGDDAACREAEAQLGTVATYCTKTAVTRHSALFKAPRRVQEEIREAVKAAVADRHLYKPYTLEGPYEMKVRYMSTDQVDPRYCDGREAIRLDGYTVLYKHADLIRLLVRAF